MPSLIARLLHPTRTPPPPVDVDLGRVMLVGTGVWTVAFVVAAVLAWGEDASWMPAWVCATGIVLGLLGMVWARRNTARRG
ncbi:DUF2530 domain-containing protein [Cellulomonas xylanilytica]|uniref:DUF2530 domain-containing protein n=1 Tax=Cellulomonas xylanilytica TaxID=233583 RepID=A0A510V3Q7_9CELL|nr:DUF2530 domain-containing protein [Cellulomonas xylanilytica]GEK21498.1 hypothetical protein CXY01_20180 [Cellulomonas xylanilytica]